MIEERFDGPSASPLLKWFNEPDRWELDGCLRVWANAGTDFWQRTHYGFRADSGHLLCAEAGGGFTMETRVRFAPLHQYDQAGLMARVSADEWLKVSVEYEPSGPARLGAVVTRAGFSDWSTQDFPRECREIELRVDREGATFLAYWRLPGGAWTQLRVAPLAAGPAVRAGVYACSPKGGGFMAEFAHLRIAAGAAVE